MQFNIPVHSLASSIHSIDLYYPALVILCKVRLTTLVLPLSSFCNFTEEKCRLKWKRKKEAYIRRTSESEFQATLLFCEYRKRGLVP